MSRTNEEWASAVKSKILEVYANSMNIAEFSSSWSIARPGERLAVVIDHTLLKPDATPSQIDELCDQAIRYNFKSCCVSGANIRQVAERLRGSQTVPCAVVGFPLGAGKSSVKAFEAKEAIADGAKEIDVVINIGALKASNYSLVYDDILAVVEVSGENLVKVILETVFLSDEEKIAASYISAEAGAALVKTCTGFSGGGASAADVSLMKKAVAYKGDMKVKASAGIRNFEICMEMLRAGADRIGTSSGVGIMEIASAQPDNQRLAGY